MHGAIKSAMDPAYEKLTFVFFVQQHTTEVTKSRPALFPRQQIMAQFYAAMVTSGLQPKDLLAMKASTHPEAIVAFTDAVMGCLRMDQVKKSSGLLAPEVY